MKKILSLALFALALSTASFADDLSNPANATAPANPANNPATSTNNSSINSTTPTDQNPATREGVDLSTRTAQMKRRARAVKRSTPPMNAPSAGNPVTNPAGGPSTGNP